MRRFFISGNWKMNTTISEAESLVSELKNGLDNSLEKSDVVICPPYLSIPISINVLKSQDFIQVGAQNIHQEKKGAFTGEISAEMVLASGCKYVIIGHSERREYFDENDALINAKIKTALNSNLTPILCVGEVLDERKSNSHFEVVKKQLQGALDSISTSDALKIVIAYEPVWAIGTGETATPLQAQEMHLFIRKLLSELYDESVSESVRIVYGGSMKPENAHDLLSQPDVDGGLIGGASLKADSFLAIIETAEKIIK